MLKILKKWKSVTLLVIVGMIGTCMVSYGYETARYTVAKSDGAYELRDYAPMIMVAAPMNNAGQRAGNQSFQKLFRYISRGNDKQQKIAMTTPVFGDAQEEDGKMYFVLPEHIKIDEVPKPTDADLEIVETKETRFAAYRYSGRASDADRAAAAKKLMEWVKNNKLEVKGEVIWAGYNSPWTPGPLRRNEALVEVTE